MEEIHVTVDAEDTIGTEVIHVEASDSAVVTEVAAQGPEGIPGPPGVQGPPGPPGVGPSFDCEVITISAEQTQAKAVTLSRPVSNTSAVMLIPAGGIPQIPGVDFIVNGDTISWDSFGLDGFLEPGDTLLVQY